MATRSRIVSGYMLLGKKLLEGKIEYGKAWNFGPNKSQI